MLWMRSLFLLAVILSGIAPTALSQPTVVRDSVCFTFSDPTARSVAVVGDFNGWSKDEDLLKKGEDGRWSLIKKLEAGSHQYKFVVDGEQYENDPHNQATITNYNNSGENSVFLLSEEGTIVLTAAPPTRARTFGMSIPPQQIPGRSI